MKSARKQVVTAPDIAGRIRAKHDLDDRDASEHISRQKAQLGIC